jgi:azurin
MSIWKKLFPLFPPLLFILLTTAQPAAPVTTISLNVKAGLQFDIVRFRVNPGAKVKIILTNTDDMSHNLLVTKPGTRLKVVNAAMQLGEKGLAMNYVPKIPEVLFAIRVVAPNDRGEVVFTAPSTSGIYPYVCTLPGHGFVMYGAMYVTKNSVLPDVKKDEHIPPSRREEMITASPDRHDNHTGHQPVKTKPLHPYTPKSPYLYRVFIDGASPAAIAVSLPHAISYCWDAGACHLRFAWKGGFLDNSDLWKGKGDAEAKVVGRIFYRDSITFPLHIGNADSTAVAYKGYRLINRYPEFHYTVNGVDVYELILPTPDGGGLIREFKIPGVTGEVSFDLLPQDGMRYTSSTGIFENNRLLLSSAEAKHFSITITNGKGAAQ